MKQEIQYLNTEDILKIAQELLQEYRVRDYGLLDSAAARPRTKIYGQEAYKNIFDKASAFFESMVMNHAFFDGNKRISWTTINVFFYLNQYKLADSYDQKIAEDKILDFVNKKLIRADFTQYLKEIFVEDKV